MVAVHGQIGFAGALGTMIGYNNEQRIIEPGFCCASFQEFIDGVVGILLTAPAIVWLEGGMSIRPSDRCRAVVYLPSSHD